MDVWESSIHVHVLFELCQFAEMGILLLILFNYLLMFWYVEQGTSRSLGLKSVSLSDYGRSSLSFTSRPRSMRLRVSCAVSFFPLSEVFFILCSQLFVQDAPFGTVGENKIDSLQISNVSYWFTGSGHGDC